MRRTRACGIAALAMFVASCPLTKPATVKAGQGATLVTPAGWSQTPWSGTTAFELRKTRGTSKGPVNDGTILVRFEKRISHDDAVDRLVQIAAELPGATFLLIDGWPALQRRQRVVVPPPTMVEGPGGPPEYVLLVTTAVAAGDQLVRAEGSIRDGATSVATEAETIGRSLTFVARADAAQSQVDLQRVQSAASQPVAIPIPIAARGAAGFGPSTSRPGAPAPAGTAGRGELEVAANGNQVVVAGQNGLTFFSNDGGLTFAASVLNINPAWGNSGDPSITRGASGAYYMSILTVPGSGCAASVFASAPGNPSAFNFVGHGAFCPGTGGPMCFPDQEHIAADPNPSSTGTDQVYMVWRHLTPIFGGNCPTQNLNFPTPTISCSKDGGVTWRPPVPIAAGDTARVTVGGDGSVWVVHRAYSWLQVTKFSSCENNLQPQPGYPKNIAPVTEPACPVPGLDRCSGDMLSSGTLAVDQTNPNHVFLAYANGTGPSNDDIVVIDSTDGFATWPSNSRAVIVSSATTGRRFMPWSCAIGSSVQVGWYDRSGANSGANDLTAYFRSSASLQSGSLVAGTEVNVSQVNDAQCASGFPWGHRDNADETCSMPQNDGRCLLPGGGGSGTPCRQANPGVCPFGEGCVANAGNGGGPKYGDYNGIACTPGHPYSAWASATLPSGVPSPGGISVFVDSAPCGGPGQACCLAGAACATGLTCAAGTCAAPACGGPGQPCCAGNTCSGGSGCLAGTCATCPPPTRTLVDTTVHAGANCLGNQVQQVIGQQTCDPGYVLGSCTATVDSLQNGSTCTAAIRPGTCSCLIIAQTPHDCSKWVDCRAVLTEAPPPPIPAGCP